MDKLQSFLGILQAITPLLGPILALAAPKLNQAAIPHIVAAVGSAETLAIPGTDKKNAAVAIAVAGLQAASAAGVKVGHADIGDLATDVPAAVQLAVDITNAVQKHPAAAAVTA